MNKILSFDMLKAVAAECDERIQKIVGHYYRRATRKTPEARWGLNPWAEVRRLKAFIEAMRQEELMAAKNSLDLYAENESLQRYRELADGKMHMFVPVTEYQTVSKELAMTQEKLSRVSMALDEQEKAWSEYVKKQPVSVKIK